MYDKTDCPTLVQQGGNREPMIVASRGRNPDNPSDRTPEIMLNKDLNQIQRGYATP